MSAGSLATSRPRTTPRLPLSWGVPRRVGHRRARGYSRVRLERGNPRGVLVVYERSPGLARRAAPLSSSTMGRRDPLPAQRARIETAGRSPPSILKTTRKSGKVILDLIRKEIELTPGKFRKLVSENQGCFRGDHDGGSSPLPDDGSRTLPLPADQRQRLRDQGAR